MAEPSFLKGWRRLAVALGLAGFVGWLLGHGWEEGARSVLIRSVAVALIVTLVFSVFEVWPRRLPRWLARWVLQVVGVGVAVPLSTLGLWMLSTKPGAPQFWDAPSRFEGWMMLTFFALLVAPWTALAALVRQKEAIARHQALAFELERSELERQALVDAGSPRASAVLRSLTAYLRAAVPLLHEPSATVGRELELVEAYLDLMHTRMPDRLRFDIHADDAALAVRCPPTTLLTLVENAVRHGIDPSEEGGRIDIEVLRQGGRGILRVRDTGVGLQQSGRGLGTGLSTLRERLQMMFGDDAQLRVTAGDGGGVCAEVEIPA